MFGIRIMSKSEHDSLLQEKVLEASCMWDH